MGDPSGHEGTVSAAKNVDELKLALKANAAIVR